ncbi:MAG: hypothetical protein ACI4N3_00505 [Alphaproteobacteria bacterium]
MKKISSLELNSFVHKCPEYDGRMYYPCVQNCFENQEYMKDICKKVKKEYYNEIERIVKGQTR